MDHARVVLGACVPDRLDRLLVVLQRLEQDHFREEVVRNFYVMLERYYNVANDVMPQWVLSDLLVRNGVDVARTLLYEELYADLASQQISDHEFRYSIDALKDSRAEQLTGEAITLAFEVLQRGAEVDRRELRGHHDARELLYSELSRIDKLGDAEQAPEGDIRLERESMLADYARRKEGTAVSGIYSGIPVIDNVTSGFQPGEMVLLCGYTGEGKSVCATQVAWHAATQQGKNVFFATSETVRDQVRRRLIARHSRSEAFGSPEGLNSAAIKSGNLSPDEEDSYQATIADLASNPSYGKLYVAQIPRGGTLGFLEARLNRQQSLWNIDLVVIDYLALMRPDRKRQVRREEAEDLLKDAKVLAVTFDGGRGIPLISPWAMSQNSYRDALKTGAYTLANLADTSEAEKSSDVIISMLRLPELQNEVKIQFLKNRDGETPLPFSLRTDYRCSYLAEKSSGNATSAVLENVLG